MQGVFRVLFVAALVLAFAGSNPRHAGADGPIQPQGVATLTVSDVTVSEGGTANFNVTLTGVEFAVVYTFDYTVLPFSATAGQDFTPISGFLSFFDIVPPTPSAFT